MDAGDPGLGRRTCALASDLAARLGQCGVVVPAPLTIRIGDDLPEHCLGLFDCDTGEIAIRPPRVLAAMIGPRNALRGLDGETLFTSTLAHEMTHAAFDGVPCPFADCLATTEYLAYAMQIWVLPEADRQVFESNLIYDRTISRDEISKVFLFLAPERFAQKAWLHLSQRDDPCAHVQTIMSGATRYDYGRF